MESGDDVHALAAGGKVFNDPIHGHIELHPLMVRIIDTPQFQRLRYIKQLGAGYYVFPGACHNRFEHSIGVSHLAGELVEVLKKKQPELGITDCDVLCVRIAGLCHDLGHGPFSHMFDGLFIPRVNPGSGWKHEKGSVDMFEHLLTENNLLKFFRLGLTDNDVVFIKEQIAGPLQSELASQARPSDWPYLGRPKEMSFLYEVVANKRNGIDVDKWDYFARDCHYLGMANNFDARRCMKFARVIDDGGRKQICTRDNEATNLYQMFHTRCFLHRRAYQHKTNTVIQLMFTEALVKANDHLLLPGKDGSSKKMSEAIDDMHAYTHLTDHTLHQILVSTDPNLEEAKELLRRVERRQLYKCVGRTKAIPKERSEGLDWAWLRAPFMIPGLMVTEDSQLTKEDIVAFIATFDYGKGDENPIDHVRFYRKDELKKAIKLEKDEVSLMLPEQFKEQYVWVYCKKDDELSCKAARRYFLQWCSRQKLNPYPQIDGEELEERSTREAATAATTESA